MKNVVTYSGIRAYAWSELNVAVMNEIGHV